MASNSPTSPSSGGGRLANASPQLIAGVVVAVLAGFFIGQNRKKVDVHLLFVSVEMRVWTIILISMALGALLTWLVPRALRRRRG